MTVRRTRSEPNAVLPRRPTARTSSERSPPCAARSHAPPSSRRLIAIPPRRIRRERPRLRRAGHAERHDQPAEDDDARGLPRGDRALRHLVHVRRRGRGGRLDHPAPRRPDRRDQGRRLDPPAADPRDAAAAAPAADAALFAPRTPPRRAEVILETKVDALDITVLKGGGDRGRELGPRARVLPPAGRARGPRLLRRAEPDLPGGPLQRRARREPRRADRAGHTGPHRDPHAQPVGASPHPGARPQGLRDRAGGRLPAHRSTAGDTSPGRAVEGVRPEPARADPGGERAGVDDAPRGPPLRPRDEVAPRRATCGSRTSA